MTRWNHICIPKLIVQLSWSKYNYWSNMFLVIKLYALHILRIWLNCYITQNTFPKAFTYIMISTYLFHFISFNILCWLKFNIIRCVQSYKYSNNHSTSLSTFCSLILLFKLHLVWLCCYQYNSSHKTMHVPSWVSILCSCLKLNAVYSIVLHRTNNNDWNLI